MLRIDVRWDRVIIEETTTVMRPSRISVTQWFEFWRRLTGSWRENIYD